MTAAHDNFAQWCTDELARVEAALSQWIAADAPANLGAPMRYAVLDGGKRLRPLLVLAAAQATGPLDAPHAEAALRAGCAVELIHAYSLVHDDMPCMDNDVLRRGKATVHIQFGQAQALLAGDIEAPQEISLVRVGALAPVHWLLVPHHGSRTSSSTEWVQTLKPRWAVVQAGYRNRFGHPVPSVVQRYEQAGTNLVQNTDCGAALWRSAEPEQMQCERERHLRFWDVFVQAAP